MSKKYKLSVNQDFVFEIDSNLAQELDVISSSNQTFHILKDSKSYSSTLLKSDVNQKKYSVEVNGNKYEVQISTPLDALINEMGIASGRPKIVNAIHAPMPGLILQLGIVEGQEVIENETLFILEAMKMENVITSPRTGKIKALHVKQGDAVDKGQLIVEFE